MKEIKQALRKLESLGFTLKYGNGSRIKVIPPDKSKPFYSFHNSGGLFELDRFSRRHWGVELINK